MSYNTSHSSSVPFLTTVRCDPGDLRTATAPLLRGLRRHSAQGIRGAQDHHSPGTGGCVGDHRKLGPHWWLPGGSSSSGGSGVQVRFVSAAIWTRSSRCHALDGHGILIILAPPPAKRHVVYGMQKGLAGLGSGGIRYGIYFLLGRVYTKYTNTQKH